MFKKFEINMAAQLQTKINRSQVQTLTQEQKEMLKLQIAGPKSKIPIHVNSQKDSHSQADG